MAIENGKRINELSSLSNIAKSDDLFVIYTPDNGLTKSINLENLMKSFNYDENNGNMNSYYNVLKIDNMVYQINDNIGKVNNNINLLSQKIDNNKSDLNDRINNTKSEIMNVVNANKKALDNKDNELQNLINANKKALDNKDTELQNTINANKASADESIKNLQNKDIELQNTINANKKVLDNKDNELENLINANKKALDNKDTELQNLINANKKALDNKDTELQNLINANKKALDNKDTELQNTINANKNENDKQIADVYSHLTSTYLPLSGGLMTGSIDMNTNALCVNRNKNQGIKWGSKNINGTIYQGLIIGDLSESGNGLRTILGQNTYLTGHFSMTGNLTSNGYVTVAVPGDISGIDNSFSARVVTGKAVYDHLVDNYLPLSGGTMTGDMQINTNAIYVNNSTSLGMKYGPKAINGENITGLIIGDTSESNKYGYTIIGNECYTRGRLSVGTYLMTKTYASIGTYLTLGTSGTISSGNLRAVTGGAVYDHLVDNYLPLSGGTMTGDMQINTNAIYVNNSASLGMKYGSKTINGESRTGLIIGDTGTDTQGSFTIIGNDCYTMGRLNVGSSLTVASQITLGLSGTIWEGNNKAVTGGAVYDYVVDNYFPLGGGSINGNFGIGDNSIYTTSRDLGMKYGSKTINGENITGLIIGDTSESNNYSYTIIGNHCYTRGRLNVGTYLMTKTYASIGTYLTLGTSGIISSGNDKAVTGGKVYSYLVDHYLSLSGGTITGNLTVNGSINGYESVIKDRAELSNMINSSSSGKIESGKYLVDGRLGGDIYLLVTQNQSDIINIQKGYLPLSGGTMTGNLQVTTINGYNINSACSYGVVKSIFDLTLKMNHSTGLVDQGKYLTDAYLSNELLNKIQTAENNLSTHAHKSLYLNADTGDAGVGMAAVSASVAAAACFKPFKDYAINLGASGNGRWNDIFVVGLSSGSDRNLKSDIKYISDDNRYEKLFNKLNPVSYKFKNMRKGDNHERIHTGFIAQDVEEALSEVGLSYNEFAGLRKDKLDIDRYDDDGNKLEYEYSLRYLEFVSLNTYMIQKSMKRIDYLENENKELKEELNNVYDKVNNLENLILDLQEKLKNEK